MQPLSLLILADVKIELQNGSVNLGEKPFEVIDLSISAPPDLHRNELVNSLDENPFVLASVEDSHLLLPWDLPVRAPEEVVVKLSGVGIPK